MTKFESEQNKVDQNKVEAESQPQEIERKFIIDTIPEDLDKYPNKEIKQGYVSISEDGTEVRLRKKGNKFFQTIKSGGGKTRTESEIEITEDQFKTLWPTTEGKRVEKTRYEIPHQEGKIELDVYHGDLDGFISAEMEFESEEASNKFEPPKWLGKEVTEDKKYKNQSLAIHGLPKERIKKEKLREKLDIPEYGLEEGIKKLISVIREKETQQENPVIVEVAGGSASGKTSAIAAKVKEEFGNDALIFSMDDYYRGKTFMDQEAAKGNELNWDQPEALNLNLLQKHLQQLKEGQAIQKPIYDMKTSESTSTEELQPKKVIIIEGLFALNDKLKDQGDIKAFIDIGTHGRILRRLLRDVERTGQKPADILKYFSEVVEPMHEKYIESTKKNADMIIENEYSPKIEAQRSGLHEVQLKFKAEVDTENLRKLGAEKLSSTSQIDSYYNPADRDMIKTGEILRIREENNVSTLTYKGPKEKSKYRKRPKFEFELDNETKEKFLSIYGDKIKTIKKDRTLYQLDGVIFAIDDVSKTEGDKTEQLGKFIEIRSTDKEIDDKKIDAVISKLKLNEKEGIKESYFEM